ncbi:Alcohol dehydrogenase [Cyphellophora attinorum]|uniref:Alcohol dehydrogenase n=1 Tax=Cyphellophora attinorum TaxID=1664694 RepID=A0A0N1HLA0_9EURO|nr:Alcohol dehydrogenase [Phialophora attinorum]KPI37727.1 Alcohol dehydrogenase [Phialophora attinorum]
MAEAQPPPVALPQTQRAQILHEFNQPYTYTPDHTLPISTPSDLKGHEILVRVAAASYCHTDHVFASGAMQPQLPRIGSHEFAGTIHSFGPALSSPEAQNELGLSVGQLVGVPGRAKGPCGSCEECRSGKSAGDAQGYGVWCSKAGNLGLSVDGGWQEWCVVDGRQVAPVPTTSEGESKMAAVDVAPLMCAGVTVWSALKRAGLKMDALSPNSDHSGRLDNAGLAIAILGAGGGLGHLGVQFASRLGATVIAADVGPSALALCREIASECAGYSNAGRVHVVDSAATSAAQLKSQQPELFNAAQDALEDEIGAHASIILPEAQAAFNWGMAVLKNHARCVVVSFPKDGWKFQHETLSSGILRLWAFSLVETKI